MPRKLAEYEAKRSFSKTPEPSGGDAGEAGDLNRFVIQEHHARRLHWDLRLERDGVLASWALPRGVPPSPKDNRLAVRTEDHPLEYLDFHGEIPKGEYGAGTMTIWDRGTYVAEKFTRREGRGRAARRAGAGPLRPVPDQGQELDDPPDGPAVRPGPRADARAI